jgi:hypothetical protein
VIAARTAALTGEAIGANSRLLVRELAWPQPLGLYFSRATLNRRKSCGRTYTASEGQHCSSCTATVVSRVRSWRLQRCRVGPWRESGFE